MSRVRVSFPAPYSPVSGGFGKTEPQNSMVCTYSAGGGGRIASADRDIDDSSLTACWDVDYGESGGRIVGTDSYDEEHEQNRVRQMADEDHVGSCSSDRPICNPEFCT